MTTPERLERKIKPTKCPICGKSPVGTSGVLKGGVGLATVPRDRFVSLGASFHGGEIRSSDVLVRFSYLSHSSLAIVTLA